MLRENVYNVKLFMTVTQSFVPVSLIGVEGGNATRISRFANYLRNLLPSSDPVVMEMASKAMGHLSMAGDTFTAEYVEFEVKRALEWLGADRNEGRRHAAVSDKQAAGTVLFVVEIAPLLCGVYVWWRYGQRTVRVGG